METPLILKRTLYGPPIFQVTFHSEAHIFVLLLLKNGPVKVSPILSDLFDIIFSTDGRGRL